MKDKEIIERKLEILLKEYRTTEDRMKRLKPIIETYASRYIALTGKSYTSVNRFYLSVKFKKDRDYERMEDE